MKRKLLTFFTSLLFILSIMGFTACSDSPVSFKLNFVVDGEIIKTIDTNGQEAISMPQNPSVEGYTFDGWFWDNGTWQRPFTANSLLNEPLTSDMSVYAKFTKNHTHNYSEQVIQPTCTEKGYTLHTCSCGDSYKDTYVNAIGHDYNTPTYVWNGQNCTAMRVCLNDGSHIETETVKGVYIKDTEATCLTPEKGHYKATFFNSAFIEQSTLKDSINNGNSLGHDYKYKNFTWVGYSAKINYECNGDSKHTLSYDAEITNVITLAPTCNATGIRTYIATYGDYSDTKDEILPKIVNEEWDGQSASQNFLYGTGTEINPYLITGPAELVLLRNNVNNGVSYNGMHFKLCCDINLGGNEWTPIGFAADDVNNSFKGEFNGNNYKILNFKTKTIENCVSHGETVTCNMGFFGSIENAVVKNLTIDSYVIKLNIEQIKTNTIINVGGIVAKATTSEIKYCYFYGEIDVTINFKLVAFIYDELYIGGIVGNCFGTITNCASECQIKGNSMGSDYGGYVGPNAKCFLGGVVGCINGDIFNSSYLGSLIAYSRVGTYCGGICSTIYNGTIENCSAKVDINSRSYANTTYSGGICAKTENAIIKNTFCNCKIISNPETTGGKYYMGGIAGYMSSGMIEYCSSLVQLNSKYDYNSDVYAGGIVGYVLEGKILNNFASGDTVLKYKHDYGYSYGGGIVGFCKGNSSISQICVEYCISYVKITNKTIGAIIGWMYEKSYIKTSNLVYAENYTAELSDKEVVQYISKEDIDFKEMMALSNIEMYEENKTSYSTPWVIYNGLLITNNFSTIKNFINFIND